MLKIRNWTKWQRGILTTVRKSREARLKAGQDVDMDAPVAMQHIAIATTWDHDFVDEFGQLVGQRNAETYFIRVLQYVALHDGFTGECPVDREEFGDLVLSRRRDKVSKREGEKVFDALIASGLCELVAHVSRYGTQPVTASATHLEPSRARVPVPACLGPDSPPPACHSAGGSASPPSGNGSGPPDEKPLSEAECAAVIAACGALIGTKDIDPAVRQRAKDVDRLTRSGFAPPAATREFVNSTVMPRTPARIAYTTTLKGSA